ncbi:uncharacterized protein NPIL_493881 [Nephila pilipes]|uniref:Uncharacterized protein n=1 Tax=Nephila pilipes TaxID=299642 RepID=A0A8X6Q7Z4_NEPPI|nr:uncharacterized protein NPIL_493881 [Nephila pilipes]
MAVRSKWKKRRGFLKEEKKNKTQKPSIRYAAVDNTTSHESRLFLSHRSPATTPDRHHPSYHCCQASPRHPLRRQYSSAKLYSTEDIKEQEKRFVVKAKLQICFFEKLMVICASIYQYEDSILILV